MMVEYIERKIMLDQFIEGDSGFTIGWDNDFTDGYNFAVNEYRDKCKAIPAADVQQVKRGTAEYMHTLYTLKFVEVYKCTACGSKIETNAGRHTPYSKENKPKFCTNCGADLRGGEENE